MPRLVHSLPTYRKHKRSGQAVVTLNGRDHYLGPHGTRVSKREYDRVVAEWLATGRSAAYGAKSADLLVVQIAAAYLKYARAYYGTLPSSELHRIIRVIRPLRQLYGRTPAIEFGVAEFKAIRQQLIEVGLSRTVINASMKRVRRLFGWAAGEGMLPASIPDALRMVAALKRGRTAARETKPVGPADDAIVDATLQHLPEVLADLARFQRLTGCRPAEACAIRPCDINRSVDPWQYRPATHKTAYRDKERVIFIGPKAQAILLRYLARDSEAFCFRPCDSESKRRAAIHAARKTPLSCGNKPGSNRKQRPKRSPGLQYNSRSYHQAVRYACRKAFPAPAEVAADPAKLKEWLAAHHWAPNQLRHSAATEVRQKFGLEAAQTVLGHSQANVTQIYAERDHALAASVARQIG
jgi:integrase